MKISLLASQKVQFPPIDMSKTPPGEQVTRIHRLVSHRQRLQGIVVRRNEVFLLPTRLIPSSKDLEEDLSDVSLEEGIVETADIDELMMIDHLEKTREKKNEKGKRRVEDNRVNTINTLDQLCELYGYDVDGRDFPDDVLFDSFNEASAFSQPIFCGESHEIECVALWDYFGGDNYDDLNVHAGDSINVIAEEYQ